jgi:hypothetical protein
MDAPVRANVSKNSQALSGDENVEEVIVTASKSRSIAAEFRRYEPDSYIQTGQGQAIWQWNTVNLNWSRPVT